MLTFTTTTMELESELSVAVGQSVSGTGIAGSTTVSALNGRIVTLSAAPTAVVKGGMLTFQEASSGTSTLTLDSATGLAYGQQVTGTGLQAGTTVSSIYGTTLQVGAYE